MFWSKKKKKKTWNERRKIKNAIYLSRFALHASHNRGFLGFYKAFNVALISYFFIFQYLGAIVRALAREKTTLR